MTTHGCEGSTTRPYHSLGTALFLADGFIRTQVTLLSWLVGFPSALWVGFRVDTFLSHIDPSLHPALRGAIDIYIVLLALLVFRLVILGFRWLFPVIEIEGSRSIRTRASLSALLGSPLVAVVWDMARMILTK